MITKMNGCALPDSVIAEAEALAAEMARIPKDVMAVVTRRVGLEIELEVAVEQYNQAFKAFKQHGDERHHFGLLACRDKACKALTDYVESW